MRLFNWLLDHKRADRAVESGCATDGSQERELPLLDTETLPAATDTSQADAAEGTAAAHTVDYVMNQKYSAKGIRQLETTRVQASPFVLEVLVSAGPRHSSLEEYRDDPQRRELGEDCAGTAAMGGASIFWICDGTSCSTKLPSLARLPRCSSRFLAQDLASGFAACMIRARQRQLPPTSLDLKPEVFDPLARQWGERLAVYLDAVRAAGKLEALLDTLPQSIDGTYQMKWSSTFLGGVFEENPRTLDLVNYGDCSAIIEAEPNAVVAPNAFRVIFQVSLLPDQRPTIAVVTTANEETAWRRFSGVNGFLAMTDGLTSAPSLTTFLTSLQQRLGALSFAELRECLARTADASEDDKAILIGRFLE